MPLNKILHTVGLSFIGLVLALVLGEVFIRVATLDQQSYVVEMWRYAKLIKVESTDPAIGHQHRPNRQEKLQNVEIRTNSLGLRGPELRQDNKVQRRVAIIGDSIALGWGVPEQLTLSSQLNGRLGETFEVVNAGVGNMNMSQIVAHWKAINQMLPVDTVIVVVTARAAEKQNPPSKNWLLKQSILAALVSTVSQRITLGAQGKTSLVQHYEEIWSADYDNSNLLTAFSALAELQAEKKFNVIVLMIPEANDMKNYQFSFINDIVEKIANKHHWKYVDPLTKFKSVESSEWHVSKNDIHLNGKAFSTIVDLLEPKIVEASIHENK